MLLLVLDLNTLESSITESATVVMSWSLVVYQLQILIVTSHVLEMLLSHVELEIGSMFTKAPIQRVQRLISRSMDIAVAIQRLIMAALWPV